MEPHHFLPSCIRYHHVPTNFYMRRNSITRLSKCPTFFYSLKNKASQQALPNFGVHHKNSIHSLRYPTVGSMLVLLFQNLQVLG